MVDTSVWSLFLRRKSPGRSVSVESLKDLIRSGRAQVLGSIRQELLSGIKDKKQLKAIEELLSDFPDLLATSDDHTLAAKFCNQCRSKGVQGSSTDFLICAQATNGSMEILAEDKDFELYEKHIPVRMMKV